MNKNIFILSALFVCNVVFSQVGINTANPQGIFHVDGAKDNNTTTSPSVAQQANDFIVLPSGNVGIGTTTPTRKLEIISTTSPALTLNDGSQRQGYYLISDSNGNGSWKAINNTILADFPTNGYNGAINTTGYTGVSITLPPGKWLVLTNIVLAASVNPTSTGNAWVRLQWGIDQVPNSSSSGNGYNIIGRLNSGVFVSPKGLATGASIINNLSTQDTTFYLNLSGTDIYGNYIANWNNLGAKSWDENSIIAYPAN